MTFRRKISKRFLFLVGLAALGGAGMLMVAGCDGKNGPAAGAKAEQLYSCGMHPQVIQDHPGNCPICGMKLTPLRQQPGPGANPSNATPAGVRKVAGYKSTMMPGEVSPTPAKDSMGMEMVPVYEEEGSGGQSSAILLDPVTIQKMGLRTGVVTEGPVRRTVRTVGTIDFDETALAEVTTKFKGWIEKLYVDYTGQQVHRGDPLFEVYSPELYSAQTEYLLAIDETVTHAGVGADLIKRSALDKLRYFDVSEQQIAELEKARQVKKTLQVSAPRDGIVIEKMVTEGQMVEAGMKLYRLADLGTVWVQSQVYEQDLPFVKLGQEATVSLSYLPDRKFRGRVTFIYPTVDDKTRTARVRMEFHNPGFFLKPGMFTTVELLAELAPSALLVPDTAILRTGERSIVFVAAEGGRFDPRDVTLGPRTEANHYQVLAGLMPGERVVTSGQFLLDSESQLREAIERMRHPGARPGTPPPHGSEIARANAPARSGTNGVSATEKVVYICPMPEHVVLEYENPGKCPLCGMVLVPVSQGTLSRIQPGGRVEYWTCPMAEHSDVHQDRPGKCSHCGMTLIPVMTQPQTKSGSIMKTNLPVGPTDIQSSALYTCPMAEHADVVTNQPGKCPKCDMTLLETSRVDHGKIAEANWRRLHP